MDTRVLPFPSKFDNRTQHHRFLYTNINPKPGLRLEFSSLERRRDLQWYRTKFEAALTGLCTDYYWRQSVGAPNRNAKFLHGSDNGSVLYPRVKPLGEPIPSGCLSLLVWIQSSPTSFCPLDVHGVQVSAHADVNIWSRKEKERSCWRDGTGIGEIGEKMGEKMGWKMKGRWKRNDARGVKRRDSGGDTERVHWYVYYITLTSKEN